MAEMVCEKTFLNYLISQLNIKKMSTSRNVLITGASSGIGAAIARAFLATGDTVTATGATNEEIESAHALPDMAARWM